MSELAIKTKPETSKPNNRRKPASSKRNRNKQTPHTTIELLVDEIVKGLEFVKFGVSANPIHPILSNVLLSLDRELQQVQLTSNNLEFSTTFTLEAKVNNDAKIALPFYAFQQVIKKLPIGQIQLKTNFVTSEIEDAPLNIQLLVTGDNSTKFNFRGTSAESFPLLTSNNLQPIAAIEAKTLIYQLGTSVFAANPKDGQRILQGTHLIFSRGTKRKLIQLETWTTNGRCLAITKNYFSAKLNKLENPIELTVPNRVLQILKQNLNKSDLVEIYLDTTNKDEKGNAIEFRWDNKQLTSRTIEGNFPNCSELMDKFQQNYNLSALVDRQNLLSTLERFSVIADKKTNIVKLILDPEEQNITLTVDNKEVAKGRETHRAKIDSDRDNSLEILFDIKYLTRVIKTISEDTIYLKLGSPTEPITISPATSTSLRTEHLLAIAPIGL
jgi:DNA polymerase III subunit beta